MKRIRKTEDALMLAEMYGDEKLAQYVKDVRRTIVTPYEDKSVTEVTEHFEGVLKAEVVDMDHEEPPAIDFSQHENIFPMHQFDSDEFDASLLGVRIVFYPSGTYFERQRHPSEILDELDEIKEGYKAEGSVIVTIACQDPLVFTRQLVVKPIMKMNY
jgi:hypothetical protein